MEVSTVAITNMAGGVSLENCLIFNKKLFFQREQ
jgi:hypothetical protein